MTHQSTPLGWMLRVGRRLGAVTVVAAGTVVARETAYSGGLMNGWAGSSEAVKVIDYDEEPHHWYQEQHFGGER